MSAAQIQVVRATGIARRAHAQFACRISAQEVAIHSTGAHDLPGDGFHALIIKRRAALATEDMRVFMQVNVLGEHLAAQAVGQEGGFAVERATADGLHECPQQSSGQRCFE